MLHLGTPGKRIDILANFTDLGIAEDDFTKAVEDFNLEVYSEESLDSFIKAVEDDGSEDDLEKAKKDISKLVKKVIVNKNGVRKTVYVKPAEVSKDHGHLSNAHAGAVATYQAKKKYMSKEKAYKHVERHYGKKYADYARADHILNQSIDKTKTKPKKVESKKVSTPADAGGKMESERIKVNATTEKFIKIDEANGVYIAKTYEVYKNGEPTAQDYSDDQWGTKEQAEAHMKMKVAELNYKKYEDPVAKKDDDTGELHKLIYGDDENKAKANEAGKMRAELTKLRSRNKALNSRSSTIAVRAEIGRNKDKIKEIEEKLDDGDKKKKPKLIGKGTEGDVYDLGDGKVEKVYRTQSDADAALPEYEKAMKNNPSNVVKVYSVDKKKKSVVMEKLDTEKGLRAMDAYINVVFRYNGTDDKVDQYFEKVMESDASFTKIFNGFKTSIAADKGMSAEEKKTSLWVINSLIKVKEQTGEMSDWIPENFGVDSKGTLKKFDLN